MAPPGLTAVAPPVEGVWFAGTVTVGVEVHGSGGQAT